ncbi:hypothetical protein ACFYOG_29500 [Streptomyces sp. NPDC007818]|uniref:hypothetical protein n=1 Tax=Streptomyces sp. NPDC007818 TaxID=3364780 RepID=UPI003676E08B
MSQEAASEQALPEQQVPQSVPDQQAPGAPKGLLQQMEELMAALSADLSQLDADLQSSVERQEPQPGAEVQPVAAPLPEPSAGRRADGLGHEGRDLGGSGEPRR